ncbi:related to putative zinc transporter [Armillaria ostoyae]|uniref:Related to putative zinc transporter n=1 Tax=Armillaria ostoyae TaxID=47428 RepID=A0A284RM54_ARMOS|nr:related to putative zinc transporter [Armillaria ostoyae]
MAQRSLLFAVLLLVVASLHALETTGDLVNDTIITVDSIHHCASVQQLSAIKIAAEDHESPIMRKIFAWLFPFGPAWNSVLGTFYISSVPNFILAFIPARINANTLNTMTAFATGGLLSDVFLHLVPHSFMGEHQDPGVHFVMVEEKRNILIGLGIFSGFAAFFFMEKTLRVLGGGEDDSGHSHSHSHVQPSDASSARASGVSTSSGSNNLKSRASTSASAEVKEPSPGPSHAATGPSKLSAYLNLFGDFVHNITDGLAMAASFYASPLIGATTTLACFAHEIPHEIADYSILIRSGFTKKQAMQSQFLTAVGAFVRKSPLFLPSSAHVRGEYLHLPNHIAL